MRQSKSNQLTGDGWKIIIMLSLFTFFTMYLHGQSMVKNGTDTAFNGISDIEKQKCLKDFYVFWEEADEKLLASSTSKNIIDHDRNPQAKGTDYEGMLYLAQAFQAVSNLKHDFDLVEELDNDWILIRWRASGQHTGELFNVPATNKTVYIRGHDILRFANGKIVENYHIETLFQLYAQLTTE